MVSKLATLCLDIHTYKGQYTPFLYCIITRTVYCIMPLDVAQAQCATVGRLDTHR
jgi:hypothetical protein